MGDGVGGEEAIHCLGLQREEGAFCGAGPCMEWVEMLGFWGLHPPRAGWAGPGRDGALGRPLQGCRRGGAAEPKAKAKGGWSGGSHGQGDPGPAEMDSEEVRR